MSRQSMIALGVALLLGLVAVFLANSYLNGTQKRAQLAGTTRVAVAAVPLAYGTDITSERIRFVEFPNSSIPAGAFTNAALLVPPGQKPRIALLPIGVNEPILASKITGQGQGASIAALLPAGMRAATVRINDVSGVAGFVQPNDSVDVLITRSIQGVENRSTQLTDVLLQNVRVIAIDQNAKNSDGSPAVAKTATLEVSPIDAQKLALAQETGTLSLVLRKPGETNNPVVETVSMNDLRYNMYGGARYPAPASVGAFGMGAVTAGISSAMGRAGAAIVSESSRGSGGSARRSSSGARKPAAPPKNDIEVYRGVKSDQVKVGDYGR